MPTAQEQISALRKRKEVTDLKKKRDAAEKARKLANQQKRAAQAKRLVEKWASWVTWDRWTVLFEPWKTDVAKWTTRQRFVQAAPKPAVKETAAQQPWVQVWETVQNQLDVKTIDRTPKTKGQLLAIQTAAEIEEEQRLAWNLRRDEEFWVGWTQDIELKQKAKSEMALENIATQRKLAEDLLARKKAAIASWLSEPRWTVQTWSGALVGSAIDRAESASSILENQLETSRLTIQGAQDRLTRAQASWDSAEIIRASQELRANRSQMQGQKIQLLQIQREDASNIWSLLTGTESDAELLSISEEQWVDAGLLTLIRDNKLTENTWEVQRMQAASQATAFKNFQSLDTSQVAALWNTQADQFNKTMWLAPWTVQSFILAAQEAENMTWEEKRLKQAEIQSRINENLAQAQAVLIKAWWSTTWRSSWWVWGSWFISAQNIPLTPAQDLQRQSDVQQAPKLTWTAYDRAIKRAISNWYWEEFLKAASIDKLSWESAKIKEIADWWMRWVQNLTKELSKPWWWFDNWKLYLPWNRVTDLYINDLKDSIWRLRSWWAITADELWTFENLLPKAWDSDRTIWVKLKEIKDKFQWLQSSISWKPVEDVIVEASWLLEEAWDLWGTTTVNNIINNLPE